MDSQLKERLIGASVLVVLAVIFIPILLDGPNSDRRVSRDVDLPPAGDRKTVRIDLNKPDAGSRQASSGSDAEPATAAGKTGVATSEPAEVDLAANLTTEAPAESAAENQVPTAESSGQPAVTTSSKSSPPAQQPAVVTPAPQRPDGAWTVQVGSFGQAENAESLVKRLNGLGYEAFVSRFDDGSRVHYRVRVGGYADRDAAASKAEDVRQRTGEPARPAKND